MGCTDQLHAHGQGDDQGGWSDTSNVPCLTEVADLHAADRAELAGHPGIGLLLWRYQDLRVLALGV